MKFIKKLWWKIVYKYFYEWTESREVKKFSKIYPDYKKLYDEGKMIGDLEQIVSFDGGNLYNSNFYICYDRKSKHYMLGLETAYIGEKDNIRSWEVPYLKESLKKFTAYMISNKLDINYRPTLFMSQLEISIRAESLEELYSNFKVFAYGFIVTNELIDKKIKRGENK